MAPPSTAPLQARVLSLVKVSAAKDERGTCLSDEPTRLLLDPSICLVYWPRIDTFRHNLICHHCRFIPFKRILLQARLFWRLAIIWCCYLQVSRRKLFSLCINIHWSI